MYKIWGEKLDPSCKSDSLPGDKDNDGGCCAWGDSKHCGSRVGDDCTCYCQKGISECEETCEGKWLEDLHFGEIRNLIHKDECLRN